MTGQEPPDSGRVSRSRGLLVGFLHQHDALVDTHSVREAVLAGRADHEWAADPRTREIVEELLAGVTLDRAVLGLSRRRAPSLRAGRAAARRPRPDRARRADQPPRRRGGRLAGPAPRRPPVRARGRHPRPLVPRRGLPVDVGGARRRRSTPTRAATRRTCWPRPSGSGRPRPPRSAGRTWSARSSPGCAAARRRGPPSRSSASTRPTQLIEDVPPPRDRLELQRFATQRLGKDVIDVEDVDLVRGDRTLLHHATWRLGPGDRVGIVGVNGAGKTSVLGLLDGSLAAVGRARTPRPHRRLQHLTQDLDDLDPEGRVLPTVESVRRVTRTDVRRGHRAARCSSGSASPATG